MTTLDPRASGKNTTEYFGTVGVHFIAVLVHIAAICSALFGHAPWAVSLNAFVLMVQGILQMNYNDARREVKIAAIEREADGE